MKKIRVGLIGCGGRQGSHIDAFSHMDDVEVVAVADPVEDRRIAAAKKTGAQRIYANHTELYDHENASTLDALFIAIEPTAHSDTETRAIDLGIPFLVEKPMTLDLNQADEIAHRIAEKNLITAVGFQCRYDDINVAAKNFIDSNKIVTVAASRVGGIPEVNWWRIKSLSGGQLVEQTIHQMDILRYFLGEPASVYSVATRGFITEDKCPGYFTDDLSTTLITFKSGVTATMMTGCYSENGASWDSKMTFGSLSSRMDYYLCSNVRFEEGINVKSSVDFGTICDRTFIDAVISGDPSKIRSPYSDAMKSVAFTLACNKSMETGEVVKL